MGPVFRYSRNRSLYVSKGIGFILINKRLTFHLLAFLAG